MEKLDSKKVGTFLKSLNSLEFRYLELTMQMVSSMQSLIARHKLDKARFCELFHIKPTNYVNYTKGNWNYAVDDMAQLNSVYLKLETEALEKTVPIQVNGVDNNK